MCKKILFILIIIINFSCVKQDKNISYNDMYMKEYKSLILNYQDVTNVPDSNIKAGYNELVSIPSTVLKLKCDIEFVTKVIIDTEEGLPPTQVDYYKIINFPEIGYIYKNLDIWFSGSYGTNKNEMYGETLYKSNEDEFIRYDSDISINPNLSHRNKILYNNEWKKIFFDRKNKKAWIEIKDSPHVIYDLNKMDLYPFDNYGFFTAGPITTSEIILVGSISLKFKYNVQAADKLFILYDYQKKSILKKTILPLSGRYSLIKGRMYPKISNDSRNFIYLMQDFKYFEEFYNSFSNGHLMIFDMKNDILYNLYHDFIFDGNDCGKITGVAYVMGDDGAIYYQLVTETYHFIYKMKPLWDEPMEEIEYNPVFFEFYPELEAEWDMLVDRIE